MNKNIHNETNNTNPTNINNLVSAIEDNTDTFKLFLDEIDVNHVEISDKKEKSKFKFKSKNKPTKKRKKSKKTDDKIDNLSENIESLDNSISDFKESVVGDDESSFNELNNNFEDVNQNLEELDKHNFSLFNTLKNTAKNTAVMTKNIAVGVTDLAVAQMQIPSMFNPQEDLAQAIDTYSKLSTLSFGGPIGSYGASLVGGITKQVYDGVKGLFSLLSGDNNDAEDISYENDFYQQDEEIQQFAKGGVVKGKKGEPKLAIVHAGERVIPNESKNVKKSKSKVDGEKIDEENKTNEKDPLLSRLDVLISLQSSTLKQQKIGVESNLVRIAEILNYGNDIFTTIMEPMRKSMEDLKKGIKKLDKGFLGFIKSFPAFFVKDVLFKVIGKGIFWELMVKNIGLNVVGRGILWEDLLQPFFKKALKPGGVASSIIGAIIGNNPTDMLWKGYSTIMKGQYNVAKSAITGFPDILKTIFGALTNTNQTGREYLTEKMAGIVGQGGAGLANNLINAIPGGGTIAGLAGNAMANPAMTIAGAVGGKIFSDYLRKQTDIPYQQLEQLQLIKENVADINEAISGKKAKRKMGMIESFGNFLQNDYGILADVWRATTTANVLTRGAFRGAKTGASKTLAGINTIRQQGLMGAIRGLNPVQKLKDMGSSALGGIKKYGAYALFGDPLSPEQQRESDLLNGIAETNKILYSIDKSLLTLIDCLCPNLEKVADNTDISAELDEDQLKDAKKAKRRGVWSKIWDVIKSIASGSWNVMSPFVSGMTHGLVGTASNVASGLMGTSIGMAGKSIWNKVTGRNRPPVLPPPLPRIPGTPPPPPGSPHTPPSHPSSPRRARGQKIKKFGKYAIPLLLAYDAYSILSSDSGEEESVSQIKSTPTNETESPSLISKTFGFLSDSYTGLKNKLVESTKDISTDDIKEKSIEFKESVESSIKKLTDNIDTENLIKTGAAQFASMKEIVEKAQLNVLEKTKDLYERSSKTLDSMYKDLGPNMQGLIAGIPIVISKDNNQLNTLTSKYLNEATLYYSILKNKVIHTTGTVTTGISTGIDSSFDFLKNLVPLTQKDGSKLSIQEWVIKFNNAVKENNLTEIVKNSPYSQFLFKKDDSEKEGIVSKYLSGLNAQIQKLPFISEKNIPVPKEEPTFGLPKWIPSVFKPKILDNLFNLEIPDNQVSKMMSGTHAMQKSLIDAHPMRLIESLLPEFSRKTEQPSSTAIDWIKSKLPVFTPDPSVPDTGFLDILKKANAGMRDSLGFGGIVPSPFKSNMYPTHPMRLIESLLPEFSRKTEQPSSTAIDWIKSKLPVFTPDITIPNPIQALSERFNPFGTGLLSGNDGSKFQEEQENTQSNMILDQFSSLFNSPEDIDAEQKDSNKLGISAGLLGMGIGTSLIKNKIPQLSIPSTNNTLGFGSFGKAHVGGGSPATPTVPTTTPNTSSGSSVGKKIGKMKTAGMGTLFSLLGPYFYYTVVKDSIESTKTRSYDVPEEYSYENLLKNNPELTEEDYYQYIEETFPKDVTNYGDAAKESINSLFLDPLIMIPMVKRLFKKTNTYKLGKKLQKLSTGKKTTFNSSWKTAALKKLSETEIGKKILAKTGLKLSAYGASQIAKIVSKTAVPVISAGYGLYYAITDDGEILGKAEDEREYFDRVDIFIGKTLDTFLLGIPDLVLESFFDTNLSKIVDKSGVTGGPLSNVLNLPKQVKSLQEHASGFMQWVYDKKVDEGKMKPDDDLLPFGLDKYFVKHKRNLEEMGWDEEKVEVIEGINGDKEVVSLYKDNMLIGYIDPETNEPVRLNTQDSLNRDQGKYIHPLTGKEVSGMDYGNINRIGKEEELPFEMPFAQRTAYSIAKEKYDASVNIDSDNELDKKTWKFTFPENIASLNGDLKNDYKKLPTNEAKLNAIKPITDKLNFNTNGALDDEALMNYIKENEGFRSTIYGDSLDNATIGYGHLITPEDRFKHGRSYSKAELEEVFQQDYLKAKAIAESFPVYHKLDPQRQAVLIDMSFNMGKGNRFKGLSSFRNMFASMEEGDFNKAAKSILNSNYAKQVGNRAVKNAKLMQGNSTLSFTKPIETPKSIGENLFDAIFPNSAIENNIKTSVEKTLETLAQQKPKILKEDISNNIMPDYTKIIPKQDMSILNTEKISPTLLQSPLNFNVSDIVNTHNDEQTLDQYNNELTALSLKEAMNSSLQKVSESVNEMTKNINTVNNMISAPSMNAPISKISNNSTSNNTQSGGNISNGIDSDILGLFHALID
jgi:GH24 family phage-related lysozyme (muramidase)